MQFTQKLRAPIARGEITTSIRIWQRPRVKVGGCYTMGEGQVVVDAIHEIELTDITPRMARDSGFAGIADLLRIAKHGKGERVFLINFHYMNRQTYL